MDIWLEPAGPEPSWSMRTKRFCCANVGKAKSKAQRVQRIGEERGELVVVGIGQETFLYKCGWMAVVGGLLVGVGIAH